MKASGVPGETGIFGGAGRVRGLTIGAVALISVSAFEALAVATAMPAVAADLGGLALYALAFGAPLATSVVGMALAGAWSDATGPRRPLFAGVALLVAGLLTAGLAPVIEVFVLGRAGQGLGSGMLTVSLYALVGSEVPECLRPRVFAWFAAAWVLPAMAGPALTGLILHVAGWRAVFALVPALAVPAVAVMVPALRAARHEPARREPARREPARREPARREPARRGFAPGEAASRLAWRPGAVHRRLLLATAAGSGAATLQVAGARRGAGGLGAAVVALGVVVWCALRLLPPGTFRLARGLPAVVAVRALIGAGFAGAEAFLPLLLVRERGWSPGAAGVMLTAGAVSWAATAWVQGRLSDVGVRYRLAKVGTALLVVGLACVVTAALPGVTGVLVVVGWAVGGGGMGLVYSSTSLLALHLAPPERQGETSAALTTGEALASALTLAVAGAAFAALLPAGVAADRPAGSAPYLAGLSVAAVAALLSAVGAWRIRTRRTP